MMKVPKVEMDLSTNPVDVIHAFSQRELESGICVLLGRSFAGSLPAKGQTDFMDTLLRGQNQPAQASDKMTPWTELDPCDTAPPGQSC